MSAALIPQRLAVPRLVRERDSSRPAVLLGYVLDAHGRRLWAEIVRHSTLVRPDDLDDSTFPWRRRPMLPDTTPAPTLAPAAIICAPLTPRRVYVRDPDGVSLLRGVALLTEQRTLGGIPLQYVVAFAAGVTATVPPSWISELPEDLADNVVPFPPAGARRCR